MSCLRSEKKKKIKQSAHAAMTGTCYLSGVYLKISDEHFCLFYMGVLSSPGHLRYWRPRELYSEKAAVLWAAWQS